MQNVVQNLLISKMEVRCEDDKDVAPYVFDRAIEVMTLPLGEAINQIKSAFLPIMACFLNKLVNAQAFFERDPEKDTR